jgi:hypothetical protein
MGQQVKNALARNQELLRAARSIACCARRDGLRLPTIAALLAWNQDQLHLARTLHEQVLREKQGLWVERADHWKAQTAITKAWLQGMESVLEILEAWRLYHADEMFDKDT